MIVWLASYPRSGNTFLRLLLHACYGQETYSVYDDPAAEEMGMASMLGQSRRPGLTAMRQANRVYFLKTHEPPVDDSPAIYLVRDGRDASVSYAHFLLGHRRLGPPLRTRAVWKLLGESSLLRTLEGPVRDGLWQRHVLAWTDDAAKSRRAATFIVRYEDLIDDPAGWLKAALDSLGIAVEATDGTAPSFEELQRRWPGFFRRGRPGSWRDEMPPELHEVFWNRNRQAMLGFGYRDGVPPTLKELDVRLCPAIKSTRSPKVEESWGGPNPEHEGVTERPSISMRGLGRTGDWGTTLFQYMFLKAFARRHALVSRVSDWVGRRLLRERDAPVANDPDAILVDRFSLSRRQQSDAVGTHVHPEDIHADGRVAYHRAVYLLNDPALDSAAAALPFKHGELDGAFVLQSRALAPYRDYLRSVLQPAPEYEASVNSALHNLRTRGRTIIAVHVLRGSTRLGFDNGACAIPASWYYEWLDGVWSRVDDPVLLLCSDDEEWASALFRRFEPLTARSLGLGASISADASAPSMGGYGTLSFVEWLLLSRSDMLAIANDPSSFAAAMMNADGREFLRPDLRKRRLERFEPWDDDPVYLLPRRLTIATELMQRLRFIRASHGGRQALAALLSAPRLYAGLLAQRLRVCHRVSDARGLLRELLSPRFYFAARRVYHGGPIDPVGDVSGAAHSREAIDPERLDRHFRIHR